ncbi:MepB family protein [Flavobacterium algoritolerans]|uniref:MepB family protein n=1 Tax=Flavobacterium algoritolerans TaxID=3041254 RepID=A0ABT6VFZ8_9FLAO|nr:MepB family protein [Flavobacterium algoritolerans]MDI5896119.1 MepB family protein [Flavobacterium algoritolerans]
MIPENLIETKELVFDKCGFELRNLEIEKESAEYSACKFDLDIIKILFRVAKITPTKIGQFVTFWKRSENGPIEPYAVSDSIDFFIINTKSNDKFGQFIFPKSVLSQQGIISTDLKEGKRGIRVYPPWDLTESKQAQKTQKWQLEYFLEIPLNKSVNLDRAKQLYTIID